MIETIGIAGDPLIVLSCKNKHRVFRHPGVNNSECSRCGGKMEEIARVEREFGESVEEHEARAAESVSG